MELFSEATDMDGQIRNALRYFVATAIAFILCLATDPLPASAQTFDPVGRGILPRGRGVLAPQGGTINTLGLGPVQRGQSYQGPQIQPRIQSGQQGFRQPGFRPFQTPRFSPQQGNLIQPSNYPVGPAFTRAPTAPPCGNPGCNNVNCLGGCKNSQPKKRHFIPKVDGYKTPGQNGQLLMTPSRIVAPVGSEVVVLAGICGGDGYFVKNQPLEWMLSNDSVGQIIEVGGMHHSTFNKLVSPSAKKFDGQYAWGRTGLKPLMLTRGTPTPADDIQLLKGQTFLSLSSESPGTTYLTGVAPAAEGWDRRRASTRIHWVDGNWAIPAPFSATAGTVASLNTFVSRADGSGGISGWKVRYSIVGGAAAEFAPAGSQTAESTTNNSGEAIAQIRQRAGQFEPGITQVRVEVVRPAFGKEPELVVESGLTQVTWSAPALTIRAIGPADAVSDEPFNYRVEISNPGDQLARGVVVSTKDFDPSIEYISSTPKPTQYGNRYEWELGDIAPGSQPRTIDLQLKSKKRGTVGMCFEVASASDRLRTEACAQTEIAGACIGLEVAGPETARIGDEITYQIGIVNQCDEPLRNIQLRITPDIGLVATGSSSRVIQGEIKELAFGEKREIPVRFQAIESGRQCFQLDVVADGGHDAGLLECVVVSQAGTSGVRIQLNGGAPVQVGETTLVEATVTNTGNVPLNSLALENQSEASIEPSAVSENITVADGEEGDPYIFELGRLEPGQSISFDIEYEAIRVDGSANMIFTVTSAEAVTDTEEFAIRIVPQGSDDGRGTSGQPGSEGTPRVPNFGSPGSDNNPTEPPIAIPNNEGRTGASTQPRLDLLLESNNESISVAQREASPVYFRVTNNDAFVHDNVSISVRLPDGLEYDNIDLRDSGLRTASQLFPAVRDIKFTNRMAMRPDDSVDCVIYVVGKDIGNHSVELLVKSDQTPVRTSTASVRVTQ